MNSEILGAPEPGEPVNLMAYLRAEPFVDIDIERQADLPRDVELDDEDTLAAG